MGKKVFSLVCFALGLSSFYIVSKLILLNVFLYPKWFVVSVVFALFFLLVGVLAFCFRQPMLGLGLRLTLWGYRLVVTLVPLLLISIIEIALFSYTQGHPQWRVMNRNFAAYGDVTDLRIYMEDTLPYRATRPDRPEVKGLKGYSPIKSAVYSVNSDGFRTREFGPKKTSEIRIGFLGGSTAWGSWVRDDETIPGYLEQKLKRVDANKKETLVYNLGIEAVGISTELRFATSLLPKAKFDQLIFYDGVNDLPSHYLMWKADKGATPKRGSDTDETEELSISQLVVRASYTQKLLAKLVDFEIVQTLKYLIAKAELSSYIKAEREIPTDIFQDLVVAGADRYVRSYRDATELCERNKLRCDFFIQPFIGHKLHLTPEEKRILSYVNKKTPDYVRFYDAVADMVLKKDFANIHDLRGSIREMTIDALADPVHMTKEGHHAVAQAMFEILKPVR